MIPILLETATEIPASCEGTARKIRGFARLPLGWHYGTGVPATGQAVRKALEALGMGAVLVLDSDAFPGEDGGIAVAFYHGDRSVEVVIDPDGVATIHVEQGMGFGFQDIETVPHASMPDVFKRLLSLAESPVWRSSGFSTLSSLTARSTVLAMSHSSLPLVPTQPHQMANVAFPSFIWSAPAETVRPTVFVNT